MRYLGYFRKRVLCHLAMNGINIDMENFTYRALLEGLLEYANADDAEKYEDEDDDDIAHIDRQQLLPAYQEFLDALLQRPGWDADRIENERTIYYYTDDIHPVGRKAAGSKIVVVVKPNPAGLACVLVSYRPEYDERTDARPSIERKLFTPQTISDAMAYVTKLEDRSRSGFKPVLDALRERKFWTADEVSPDSLYCTIDLYPTHWRAAGSKLTVEFFRAPKGKSSLVVTYRKNPYQDNYLGKNPVTAKKTFGANNVAEALEYIVGLENKCRQYHQFRAI